MSSQEIPSNPDMTIGVLEPLGERIAYRVGVLGTMVLAGGAIENELGWRPDIVYSTTGVGALLAIGGVAICGGLRYMRKNSLTVDSE